MASSGELKRNFLWPGKSLDCGQGEAGRLCEEKYHHLLASLEEALLVGQQDVGLGEPLVWASSIVIAFLYVPRKSVAFSAVLPKTAKFWESFVNSFCTSPKT